MLALIIGAVALLLVSFGGSWAIDDWRNGAVMARLQSAADHTGDQRHYLFPGAGGRRGSI